MTVSVAASASAFASVAASRIETQRLVLEPLEQGHAALLYPLLQSRDLYCFLEEDPPESLEGLQKRYEFLSKGLSPDGKQVWLNWVPRDKDLGQCLGYFQATIEGGSAWLAYSVFKPFQRRQFAKEGVRGMMAFIKERYPAVKAFVIEMDTRNWPSVRLALSLGFGWVATNNRVTCFKGFESHEFRFECCAANLHTVP